MKLDEWLRAGGNVSPAESLAPQIADVEARLAHLALRMDEAENLLKRIHDHLSQFHKI